MHPSTWNDTNQHWIPPFLLKGFGIRKDASSVYEFDKQTEAIDVRKVKAAASKRHLLTDRDDEMMRGIESRAADAIDAIRKGRLNRINEEDRQSIDRLVCAMIMNDPYSGVDTETMRKDVISEVIGELNQAASRYGGTLDESDFAGYFDDGLSCDYLSTFMAREDNQIISALRLMGLQSCRPTSEQFFIIGDSPVLVIRNTVNGVTSLLNPNPPKR